MLYQKNERNKIPRTVSTNRRAQTMLPVYTGLFGALIGLSTPSSINTSIIY